jgi:hypothetical protein
MLKHNRAAFTGAGFAVGLAMLLSPAPNAQAAVLNTGTTVGGLTWDRPNVINNNPYNLSSLGTATPYNAFAFSVSASGNYTFQSGNSTFQSTANQPNNNIPAIWDNYTFLYAKTFNDKAPLTNLLAGNDDVTINNIPAIGLSGFTIGLDQGINYIFVTTGFTNTAAGTFTNTITSTGTGTAIPPIASVPEPATVLGSIVAFGYSVHSRRKQKNAAAESNETV